MKKFVSLCLSLVAVAGVGSADCCDPCDCCFLDDYPVGPPYCAWNECPEYIWLPQGAPIYRQYVADPRKINFSAAWRFDDKIFDENTGVVSFGDQIGLLRVYNPFGLGGIFQVDIDACLWALFKQTRFSAPLVNADYYGGLALQYGRGPWAARLRLYHISSHLGDEFLLNHDGYDRKNASSEFVDFDVSFQPCRNYRLFAGVGGVVRSDKEFDRKVPYIQYGAEFISPWFTYYLCSSRVLIEPFAGVYVKNTADNHWNFDFTVVAGYEFSKMAISQRKVRIYGEYHNGYSEAGQFQRDRTEYYSLAISWGY